MHRLPGDTIGRGAAVSCGRVIRMQRLPGDNVARVPLPTSEGSTK
jgi:hypothetical protein